MGLARTAGILHRSMHRPGSSRGSPIGSYVLDSFYCVSYSVCHTLCGAWIFMGTDQFESLRLELRRGCLVMAVLAQLRNEHYGYTLRKELSDRGLEIDEGTLYPLL